MLLVDILARELKEWPEEAEEIAQDEDGRAHPYSAAGIFNGEEWTGDAQFASYNVNMRELASDHATAIVTRADWQAAKDKLEGKTVNKPKANKDGWVRHRGGKCPVEEGTLVDVRYRDGEIRYKRKALSDSDCASENWTHEKDKESDLATCDIMAYRIHTPSEQTATTKESLAVEPVVVENVEAFNAQAEMPAAKYFDGPLQWRDRIAEIDAESKAEAERHCQVMNALDAERSELVQKLASEGLAMIERKAEPVEDMSDPANWKAGDLLECIFCPGPQYTEGKLYSFLYLSDWGSARTIDDDGDENGIMPRQFKWHSRPTN